MVASQKNVGDIICEKRTQRIAPLQIAMVLVGAGFCLFGLKDNHHAIFFAPLSCGRTVYITEKLIAIDNTFAKNFEVK